MRNVYVTVLVTVSLVTTLTSTQNTSQDVVEFVADKLVLVVVGNPGISRDHRVLGSNVYRVVDLPVDVSHLPRWMEQALGEREHGMRMGRRFNEHLINMFTLFKKLQTRYITYVFFDEQGVGKLEDISICHKLNFVVLGNH